MENTTDNVVLLSLTLQRENYDKMPNLVHMRKQHDQLKSNLVSIHLAGDSQEMGTGKINGDSSIADDTVDGDDSVVESVEPLKSLLPVLLEKQASSVDIQVQDRRTDSFESLPSTASEDTDSLLLCLNEHSKENKERRIFYNPAEVLRALNRRISSGTGEQQGSGSEDGLQDKQEQKHGRKMEKDDQVRWEELTVKNTDLRTHIVNLLEQLDSCELENQRLKVTVRTLEQQLATEKSQVVTQPGGFRDEFSVPFSLSAPTVGRMTTSESRILIPQTPPALSPIEMPNFDDQ